MKSAAYFPNRWSGLVVILLLMFAVALPVRAEQVVIQLKWLHQFQFAGYYAALEQGYFAEEGLDVVLRERSMEHDNIDQVLSGEAHYGIADAILLSMYAQGRDLVLVAPIFQHSPNVLMTLRSSGIRTPRDLVGRRLSFYDNNTDGIAILAMLAEQGVLRDGLIREHWSQRTERLLSGEVDAVAAYSTNEPNVMRELGHPVHIIDPKHYGMDFYGDIFFTSGEEARNHPERVERMRRAVIRGWHYALDNKEELVELIHARYNTQGKSRTALMSEALGLEPLIARHTVELGHLDAGRLDYMLGLLARHRIIEPDQYGIDRLVFESSRGNQLDLTEEEEAFLRANPRLTVGIDTQWPPFDFLDARTGRLRGISQDYLDILSELLGVSFDPLLNLSWPEVLDAAANNQLDLITSITSTPDRRSFLEFTQPYVRSPMVIVTGQQVDFVTSMEQLHGRPVAVVRDYASDEWLSSSHPLIPLVRTATTLQGLQAVAAGEVYAFVDNLAVVSYLIRNEGLANLKVSGQTPYFFDLSMATPQDRPELRSILDKALASITQQQHAEIYDRWVSLQPEPGFPWQRMLLPVLSMLALLLVLGGYTLYLQRLNQRIRQFNNRLQAAELELLEKNRQLELVSVTDKLTGVYNRHHLDKVLSEQLSLASRHQRPLSVVLFDLDYFKEVNDTYGHQAGDRVLQCFAELVRSKIRTSDVFGRWGGEEFLLICPETTLKQAVSVADKIRLALQDLPFDEGLKQHVSAGVMALSPGMNLDQLLSGVDKQLYIAKASGRNQVVG
ncbi:diguanylate cyclase [Marinospirillum alkaliphilum]|uniref:diguanylate cyclase n=1 Tax=Marinospirillum alkaliphilum DSM 21637 TaxID=1122209 RepID=A0A1K1U368_9GAMM|nr:diguanylate cyclase [Marinospirillum alkaliphilum]SFX07351.1 polar amino acid transport system substrate-binding protein [Marinospirillum alkaliphilum DSM 21637]